MPSANSSDPLLASIRAKVAAMNAEPKATPPSSKPLQIFLLIALVVTGAAYVVNEFSEFTTEDQKSLAKRPNRLRQMVKEQNTFVTETALGHEAEVNKKYNDAVLHYRRALGSQPTAQARLNLGAALLEEGNPDMAFAQFKEALRLDPQLEDTYLTWASALAHQGRLDDAAQMDQDALRANPKFAKVNYNFGRVLEQQQATILAKQRAALRASQPKEATQAASESQVLGADALKHYAAAAQLGLNTPDFWAAYGALLNKAGKYFQAEMALNKAVIEQPTLGAAQFQLAVAQDHQGKYADAISHYEATLTCLPDDPATLNNLALIYATATNQDVRSSKMAVMLATRASDALNNQDARFMDTLARAYAADGDFFQAIAWEDKAMHRATQLADNDLVHEFQPRFSLYVQHKSE